MTRSREDGAPFSRLSPAYDDSCESESRDSPSLLEIEKKTDKRTMGWKRSPYMRCACPSSSRSQAATRGRNKSMSSEAERSANKSSRRRLATASTGLSGEDVALLLISQRGNCVGCGIRFGEEINFVIDHDHETGKVRGLLCRECNIVLPHWMTAGKLRKLATYLENAGK